MKVYVITGVAGDYSDRTEWNVKAYMDEARARQEVERMDAAAREVEQALQANDRVYDISWYDDHDQEVQKFRQQVGDPYFRGILSDFPRYHLSTVDVVDLGWPESENT